MAKHKIPKKWNGEIQTVEKPKFDYITFLERKISKIFSLEIEAKNIVFPQTDIRYPTSIFQDNYINRLSKRFSMEKCHKNLYVSLWNI